MCNLRGCSVSEAAGHEVPDEWKKLGEVDYTPIGFPFSKLKCMVDDDDFCLVEDQEDSDGIYINLLNNQEAYTAYAGPSAERVWSSIYDENCFSNPLQECREHQVFYKLISGLHTSISTHICYRWMDSKSGNWIKNGTCYHTRFDGHQDRIDNLYFVWSVLVKALTKISPYVEKYPFCSAEDYENVSEQIVNTVALTKSCNYFDETELFQGDGALKDDFKSHFRNISAIMDCVGCEKCKLWGKIQITGLGTALKVLFSSSNSITLVRSELVSLFNTLHRISEAIDQVEYFKHRNVLDPVKFMTDLHPYAIVRGGTFYVGLCILLLGLARMISISHSKYVQSQLASKLQ